MSPRIPAWASWVFALLVALAAAGELEKEAPVPSCLLQIRSSVHEVAHSERGCGDAIGQAPSPTRSQLTLLQVAARTGEVAQYLPSHQDEDSSPLPHHSGEDHEGTGSHAITPERRRDIASLLSHGGGNDAGSGSEPAATPAQEASTQEEAHHEPKDLDRTEEAVNGKPDAKVVQGARIAPFGKEDTAAELQRHAARTQDTLVDAIENAEVAEIKRSIFRSLTRLRAAEIKEFDTIARLETQAIDEYNDNHHYRAENELQHIGAEVPVKQDKYTSFHD